MLCLGLIVRELGEALVAAGKIRVRPIFMTTLCTLFGLLPLALAVIGGLSISTFITLAGADACS